MTTKRLAPLFLTCLTALILAAPADAHPSVRAAKFEVREYVKQVRPGAHRIKLAVDVRDPGNHTIWLFGAFTRGNGERCTIYSAKVGRRPRAFSYSDCMGGIARARTTAVNPRQVYVLGDSYAFDMQGATYSAGRTLTQAFAARGWTAIVSGRGGRGIGGSVTPNGLQQAYTDRAKIATSSTVVVELGTNIIDGTYFATRAQQLLQRIRSYQPAARIFWVTPGNFVTSTSYQAAVARNRNVILGLAGVTKIRWDAVIQRAWFSGLDGFKHPRVDSGDADERADGYDALKTMIVEAVT